jgi:hypothetical protein
MLSPILRFAAGLSFWLGLAAAAQAFPLPSWRELTLELTPTFIVKVDLQEVSLQPAKLSPLIERPGALQPPPDSSIYRLTVETRLKWFLSSKTWTGALWVQPDLIALQRTRLKIGPQGDYKIYRYAQQGVYRIRYQPKDLNQSLEPPETWKLAHEAFYPFPQTVAGDCSFISDPYALLLLLAQEHFPQEICIFNKEGLYKIRFASCGSQPLSVDYLIKHSKPRHFRVRIQAERLLIHPLPLKAEGKDKEPFEFLGMEGDIVLLRDPTTHLPLQIEGEVPGFGQAKLRLTQVKLR